MHTLRTLLGIMLAVSVPSALHAQVASSPMAREPDDATSRWHLGHCMAGVTYGAPLKFAVAYGGGLVRQSDGRDWCAMGVAKVGLGGAQGGVGLGSSIGAVGGGASVTANILRTFGNPLHATARTTYVGASVHVWPALALGGELGVYTRVGSDNAGAKRLVTWSVGFGF